MADVARARISPGFDHARHPLGMVVRRIEDGDGLSRGAVVQDSVTVLYVSAGAGTHRQGACAWVASPGSLFAVAAGEVYDSSGLSEAEGWGLTVAPLALVDGRGRAPGGARFPEPGDPFWVAALRSACSVQHLRVPAADRRRWEGDFAAAAGELDGRLAGYEHACRARTTLLLIGVSRLALSERAVPIPHQAVVADVIAYVEDHFTDDISLDDVAAGLARSPASLARTFRRYTGHSVNEWIADRRMTEARRLLLETDVPVEEVAQRSGFNDADYFRRRFKRVHLAPPREWRRATRGTAVARSSASASASI